MVKELENWPIINKKHQYTYKNLGATEIMLKCPDIEQDDFILNSNLLC